MLVMVSGPLAWIGRYLNPLGCHISTPLGGLSWKALLLKVLKPKNTIIPYGLLG